MPDLKYDDLTIYERIRYWWWFYRVRKRFMKERRIHRQEQVGKLAYHNFHKWYEYGKRR